MRSIPCGCTEEPARLCPEWWRLARRIKFINRYGDVTTNQWQAAWAVLRTHRNGLEPPVNELFWTRARDGWKLLWVKRPRGSRVATREPAAPRPAVIQRVEQTPAAGHREMMRRHRNH